VIGAFDVRSGVTRYATDQTPAFEIEDEDDDEDDRAGFSPHADTPTRLYVLFLGKV